METNQGNQMLSNVPLPNPFGKKQQLPVLGPLDPSPFSGCSMTIMFFLPPFFLATALGNGFWDEFTSLEFTVSISADSKTNRRRQNNVQLFLARNMSLLTC